MLGAPKVKAVRGFSDFGYSFVYIVFDEGVDIYAPSSGRRYRRSDRGFDNRSPWHVIDMFRQVEEKRSKLGEQGTIVMKYRVNGKDAQEWRGPPRP